MKNRLDWGQQTHVNIVKTPWGYVQIWGNTRVPRLNKSKTIWKKWFTRFIVNRKIEDQLTMDTYLKWKNEQ